MHPRQTAALRRFLSLPTAVTIFALGLGLGACTLPTNVAIKKLDTLRAEQTTCLMSNARQLDDRTSDPQRIAREVTAACNDATERLVAHAIAKPNPQERRAFEEDAALRAAGYVKLARGGTL